MEVAEVNSIKALRNIPADQLQNISNDSTVGRFGVTLDGYVLPKDLLAHFKKGEHQQVPILAGWVAEDGTFLGQTDMTVAEYKSEAETLYDDQAATYLEIFPASTDEEVQQMKNKQTLINFAGMTAHLLAGFNTHPSYIYEFSHVPPDKPGFPNYGAFHSSEVPFALHTLHTWHRPWRPVDKEIEKMMSAYWVNFAKTGNPNGGDLPEWKAYDKTTGHILRIGETTSTQQAYMKAAFDFLEANQ